MDLPDTAAWKALTNHFNETKSVHLRERFAEDPERATRLSLTVDNIYADYSKNLVMNDSHGSMVERRHDLGDGRGQTR